ncbi:CHRD domain-containing protein [soil metagenome]
MRKFGLLLAAALLGVLLTMGTAIAGDELEFEADLSGANEVPAVATAATGEAEFEIAGDTLTYELEAEDIAGVVGAHIHSGAPGENGPIIVDLGVPGNCEVDDEELKCEATLIPAGLDTVVETMLSGNAYVNVHTAENPGGEIRGQLALD